ncbi:MAG: glycerate kinase, partial [Bacteroidales bacterium]
MRILITPDSFKDSLPANEIAGALKNGLEKVMPDASLILLPVADGGEGTVQAVVNATGGKIKRIKVHDPLMREIDSFFGITGDGNTAVIEMAAASGISLLKIEERNPWITNTAGTGELIKAALDTDCEEIVVGIGGSATNDGGAGMASALGVRFLNRAGEEIIPAGGNLDQIERIDTSLLDKRISAIRFFVACDVVNPLTGPEGASYTYGPQKGADTEMTSKLDKNLKHFGTKINEYLFKDVDGIPGAGAAGGLGAGLMAFLDARLMGGFEMVASIIDLEKEIAEADLIIT